MKSLEGTSLQEKLAFFSFLLIFAFQNPIANEVPFLFYRSDMECQIDGEWNPCKESEMCETNSPFRWVNPNNIQSVSIQFDLTCEKKLLEATIIFLGPVAQILGMISTLLIEIPKLQKFKILSVLFTIQSVGLIFLLFVYESLNCFIVIWFIWNFIWSFFYSHLMYYVQDHFSKQLYLDTPTFMNILWPVGGLVFVGATFTNGNWVNHCVYMTGVPILLTTGIFYVVTPKHHYSNEKELESNSYNSNNSPIKEKLINGNNSKVNGQQEEQPAKKSAIAELIEKFSDLQKDRTCLKNMLIYLSTWVIQMLSYSATFLGFNTAKGSIQVNVFSSICFELSGSILAIFLMKKFDCFKILSYNCIIIGIIQSLTFIVDTSFYQMVVINSVKISNKVTFTAIILSLQYLLPKKYVQLTFVITNVASIAANSVIPFYRYYMELAELNFFSGFGVLSLISVCIVNASVKLCDPNRDSTNEEAYNNKMNKNNNEEEMDILKQI